MELEDICVRLSDTGSNMEDNDFIEDVIINFFKNEFVHLRLVDKPPGELREYAHERKLSIKIWVTDEGIEPTVLTWK